MRSPSHSHPPSCDHGQDALGRPGLALFLGPANSGKMGRLLDWWAERLHLDPVVVAPTGPDTREITLEMTRRVGALLGLRPALTFDGLVAEVLEERPRYVSGFERDLILARILAEEHLPMLGRISGFPGTVSALSDLLRRFGESGRPPGQILELLKVWAAADSSSAGLAEDLVAIVHSYEHWRESTGLTERPAAVVAAHSRLASWRRPVAFYGFTSFTPGQGTLVETLAAQVPVVVTLPHDGSRSVDLTDQREVERWRALATEVFESPRQTQAYSSPSIAFLERFFMSSSVAPGAPMGEGDLEGVRFLLASGQRNEAELAAQHIAGLISQGFDPGRIAVVVRHVETWSSLLSQVFGSCGIPIRVDTGRELRRSGLGHAFLNALNGWINDDAVAFLSFLRSPYAGVDRSVVASAELAYRRGCRKGVRSVMEALGSPTPFNLELVIRAVRGQGADASFDTAGLRELAAAMLAEGVRHLESVSSEVEEDARAYGAVVGALDSLQLFEEGRADGKWQVAPVVLSALGRVVISGGPVEGQRAVQILSPHRARARRFDALFVLGLVEGEFPARSDTPSLLTERQRARIDSLAGGGVLLPELDREAGLFANVISRPWQLLYLSARDADDGGTEAVPSQLWLQSKELMRPEGGVDHHRTLADQVFPVDRAPTPRHYRRACALASRGSGAVLEGEGIRLSATWADRVPMALRDPAALAELAARDTFSPSELEGYLGCPFSWFISRVVGVDTVDSELDDRVYGQLLHSGLSGTYRELSRLGMLPIRQENLARVVKIAAAFVDDSVQEGVCPGTVSERRLASWRLKRQVQAFLEMESLNGGVFITISTELGIGGGEGVDVGGIKIRGRIDRVDADPGRTSLFIIDYKSRRIPSKGALGTAKAIQLPLYVLALGRERPDSCVVGGAYYSLAERKYSGFVQADAADTLGGLAASLLKVEADDEAALYRATVETALAAAEGIRSGVIAPPEDRDCPPYCDYGSVCRSRSTGYRR